MRSRRTTSRPTTPMSAPPSGRSIRRWRGRSQRFASRTPTPFARAMCWRSSTLAMPGLAVARAEADYQHTLQHVGQYYAQHAVAEAQVQARIADVERTADDYARRKSLVESGSVSRADFSTARA